jgi:hypothetical protein
MINSSVTNEDYIIESYEEFKNALKKPEYFGETCFVGGCNKPAEYEGGDYRFYCGMCEEHAGIRESYDTKIKRMERMKKIRKMWYKG